MIVKWVEKVMMSLQTVPNTTCVKILNVIRFMALTFTC